MCCTYAAEHGHLEALEHIVKTGFDGGQDPPSSQLVPSLRAAGSGQAHVLRYLSEKNIDGFLWDEQHVFNGAVQFFNGKSLDERAAFMTEMLDICETAFVSSFALKRLVLLGPKYFHLVKDNFVRVEGYPNEIDFDVSWIVDASLSTGSIEAFDWLSGKGYAVDESTVLSTALQYGHMEMLDTLLSRGRSWNDECSRVGFRVAASEDRLQDIQTCMSQSGGETIFGGGRGSDLCCASAEKGALKTLRFSLEKTTGHKGEDICSHAAKSGDLGVVKLVVEKWGIPLSENCIVCAVEGWDWHLLEYLVGQGCPIPDDRFALANMCMHDHMLDSLISCKILPTSPSLVEGVISASNSCELLEWALGICGTISDTALIDAVETSMIPFLKIVYTKVDEERWKKIYPKLLQEADCDEVREWVESTKTW